MTQIQHEIRINAPKDRVWKALADFGGIYKLNPGVPKSYSTSENNEGVGATRHCDLLPMGSVEERIVDWHEGQFYTIEIFDGEMMPPVKDILGTIGLREDGDSIIAYMEMEYSPKGLIGVVMNAVMVKNQFDKTVKSILQGLKHYAETGELVDGAVAKQVRQLATAMG